LFVLFWICANAEALKTAAKTDKKGEAACQDQPDIVKELGIWPLVREHIYKLQKVFHDETGKQPSGKYCEKSHYKEYDPFHYTLEPDACLSLDCDEKS